MRKPAPLLTELPPPPPGRSGWPWTVGTSPPADAPRLPRVSIVTPSFNQAAFLEETIRSVILQGYPNLEYIVADGGSTDGSVEILKKYSPWIARWTSERDAGQSDAINKGLSLATGEWFNWINSDDCLLPGALEAVGNAASPGLEILCGEELMGASLAEAVSAGHTRLAADLEETFVNHRICQQGMFFRTETVRSLGGVRRELHYVMDLDLFVRVLLKHGPDSARPLKLPLAFFRRHEAAKTHLAFPRFLDEERRLFHGLATALDLDASLRERVLPAALASESLAFDGVRASLDPSRLAARLALRYWWNEVIEIAWLRRDFPVFKRELRDFKRRFPSLRNGRINRLACMARLPDPVLRLLSGVRRAPRAPAP